MNVRQVLEQRISAALAEVIQSPVPAMVAPAARAQFGDYQANGVMAAAKAARANPHKLAEQVAARLDLSDLAEKIDIAGPGFLNIRLRDDWVAAQLRQAVADARLGVGPAERPICVVVDYSAPNLAKEMHVGHLRSTVIGDALARTLDFLGHAVIRQNHVGDWGTQFGTVVLGLWHICMARKAGESAPNYVANELGAMQKAIPGSGELRELLLRIRDRHEKDWRDDKVNHLGDGERRFGPFLRDFARDCGGVTPGELGDGYRYVFRLSELLRDTDIDIVTRVCVGGCWRETTIPYAQLPSRVVAMLQDIGNPTNAQEKAAWERAKGISRRKCQEVYERLGVLLNEDDIRGESAYNDDLPQVVADLDKAGLLKPSQGAQCVFLPEFAGKDGQPLPLIVRKSDEGYLYATTDLAAIRYRVNELKADRVLYVVDARQALHFRQVFAVARRAGFAPENVALEHVSFGTVMGPDGRPFKTREGGTVKLMDLLDEAERRAAELVHEKNPDLPVEQKKQIARIVGIGAVKYADLAQNRNSDYVFSWDKMLSLQGNTAPYMQYAYARIRSIFRKGAAEGGAPTADAPQALAPEMVIAEPPERALALKLLQFPETLAAVAGECLPNLLCSYLYDLAVAFTGFYENCPVLQSPPATRGSRLALCDATARMIRQALHLLGIETVEQM